MPPKKATLASTAPRRRRASTEGPALPEPEVEAATAAKDLAEQTKKGIKVGEIKVTAKTVAARAAAAAEVEETASGRLDELLSYVAGLDGGPVGGRVAALRDLAYRPTTGSQQILTTDGIAYRAGPLFDAS